MSRIGTTLTAAVAAIALAGCTAAPSGIVVSGTVEDRLETVAVPGVAVPAVNLDAGFTTLSGATNPVTGRTSARLSTVGSTYGFGTFVRLTDVTVAAGDTVTAGQSLGRVDDGALRAQLDAAKGDQAAADVQIDLLTNAINDLDDKASDLADKKKQVSEAIDKLVSLHAKLVKTRATLKKTLPKLRAGLAQVEAAIAALPPGVPVPPVLLQKRAELTAAIRKVTAGLKQINANLPKLTSGLAKARDGLAKIKDARVKIADARAQLVDARELSRLGAGLSRVPVALARVQLGLTALTSPVNGVVVEAAKAGAVLAPGATAVSIRETRPSRVTVWLAPSQLARVCTGDSATITGDWMAGAGIAATLTRIGTSADYPPTSVATEEVHLARAVEVEFTAAEQLPAGVPVELNINSCHPAAGTSDTDR